MNLDGANLLITGGTGSFGKRFVKHITTQWRPARLVVYSRDELKQFSMASYSARSWPSTTSSGPNGTT